ncbi:MULTISPECIES: general secretion pathway protein [Stenotrophomonas]|uniref:General secretion pathway protein n=1 Tax=Stenotrophomonas lactitubi TaxID=2045214 RepID=A0AAW4GBI0_9GAMM|nr:MULTISPECIES: general secretion pathway protein [Stenotrophomonas]MBM9912012.1 general secretion pathway protein [Stenotrophomonas lactitubi]MBM9920950.1 general secretion pathway protein [Stenotrophomonas lactitubi]MBM9937608.1 general secretion pathway protein [Stenotrophomonas lactitubi]
MDGRRWDRNRTLTLLAAMLLLAVAGYWGMALFMAPARVAAAPVQVAVPAAPAVDNAASAPLVRLLSPGAVQTDVSVLGVMAGQQAPLALLSVDGAPAQAYAPGQRLGPSTVLAAISASAVELQQAGQPRSLPVPELPPLPTDGIVPAALGRH